METDIRLINLARAYHYGWIDIFRYFELVKEIE